MSLEFARSLVFPQAAILALTYLAPDRAELDAIGLDVLFAVRGEFIQSLENQFEFVRVIEHLLGTAPNIRRNVEIKISTPKAYLRRRAWPFQQIRRSHNTDWPCDR